MLLLSLRAWALLQADSMNDTVILKGLEADGRCVSSTKGFKMFRVSAAKICSRTSRLQKTEGGPNETRQAPCRS